MFTLRSKLTYQNILYFSKGITSPESCKTAVDALGVTVGSSSTVSNEKLPPGCLLSPVDAFNPVKEVIFNNASTKIECGNKSSVALRGSVTMDKARKIIGEHIISYAYHTIWCGNYDMLAL